MVDGEVIALLTWWDSSPPSLDQGRSLERLGQLDQPLNRRNERAALRSLSGVAAFTLSRFTTTLEQDEEALVTGFAKVPAAAEAPAEGAAPAPGGSTQPSTTQAPTLVPITDEIRMSIRFRVEKKRILSAAIKAMGKQLQELSKASIPEQNVAPRKGQPPPAATEKGFGKRKS